jgi:hypothetical protein
MKGCAPVFDPDVITIAGRAGRAQGATGEAVGEEEAPAGLIRDGKVSGIQVPQRPRGRSVQVPSGGRAMSEQWSSRRAGRPRPDAEKGQLEPKRPSSPRAQVSGVIPPLGLVGRMARVVAREPEPKPRQGQPPPRCLLWSMSGQRACPASPGPAPRVPHRPRAVRPRPPRESGRTREMGRKEGKAQHGGIARQSRNQMR